MAVRITKPFTPLTPEEVDRLPGSLGVFELADAAGRVVRIGFAGGRSLFGLRGELRELLGSTGATAFRVEINTAYLTRYQELLMIHIADTGGLPAENEPDPGLKLGRLSPG